MEINEQEAIENLNRCMIQGRSYQNDMDYKDTLCEILCDDDESSSDSEEDDDDFDYDNVAWKLHAGYWPRNVFKSKLFTYFLTQVRIYPALFHDSRQCYYILPSFLIDIGFSDCIPFGMLKCAVDHMYTQVYMDDGSSANTCRINIFQMRRRVKNAEDEYSMLKYNLDIRRIQRRWLWIYRRKCVAATIIQRYLRSVWFWKPKYRSGTIGLESRRGLDTVTEQIGNHT